MRGVLGNNAAGVAFITRGSGSAPFPLHQRHVGVAGVANNQLDIAGGLPERPFA